MVFVKIVLNRSNAPALQNADFDCKHRWEFCSAGGLVGDYTSAEIADNKVFLAENGVVFKDKIAERGVSYGK